MDLKGLNERLATIGEEEIRAHEQTGNDFSEEERRSRVEGELKSICDLAARQDGKGPRCVTMPIVLKTDENLYLYARVHTFDRIGDPCDYNDAKKYEISVVKFDGVNPGTVPVATEEVWGNYPLEGAEQTVAMLWEAINNPALNPQFQDRISVPAQL